MRSIQAQKQKPKGQTVYFQLYLDTLTPLKAPSSPYDKIIFAIYRGKQRIQATKGVQGPFSINQQIKLQALRLNFLILHYTADKRQQFLLKVIGIKGQEETQIIDFAIDCNRFVQQFKQTSNGAFEQDIQLGQQYKLTANVFTQKTRFAVEKLVRQAKGTKANVVYQNIRSKRLPRLTRDESPYRSLSRSRRDNMHFKRNSPKKQGEKERPAGFARRGDEKFVRTSKSKSKDKDRKVEEGSSPKHQMEYGKKEEVATSPIVQAKTILQVKQIAPVKTQEIAPQIAQLTPAAAQQQKPVVTQQQKPVVIQETVPHMPQPAPVVSLQPQKPVETTNIPQSQSLQSKPEQPLQAPKGLNKPIYQAQPQIIRSTQQPFELPRKFGKDSRYRPPPQEIPVQQAPMNSLQEIERTVAIQPQFVDQQSKEVEMVKSRPQDLVVQQIKQEKVLARVQDAGEIKVQEVKIEQPKEKQLVLEPQPQQTTHPKIQQPVQASKPQQVVQASKSQQTVQKLAAEQLIQAPQQQQQLKEVVQVSHSQVIAQQIQQSQVKHTSRLLDQPSQPQPTPNPTQNLTQSTPSPQLFLSTRPQPPSSLQIQRQKQALSELPPWNNIKESNIVFSKTVSLKKPEEDKPSEKIQKVPAQPISLIAKIILATVFFGIIFLSIRFNQDDDQMQSQVPVPVVAHQAVGKHKKGVKEEAAANVHAKEHKVKTHVKQQKVKKSVPVKEVKVKTVPVKQAQPKQKIATKVQKPIAKQTKPIPKSKTIQTAKQTAQTTHKLPKKTQIVHNSTKTVTAKSTTPSAQGKPTSSIPRRK